METERESTIGEALLFLAILVSLGIGVFVSFFGSILIWEEYLTIYCSPFLAFCLWFALLSTAFYLTNYSLDRMWGNITYYWLIKRELRRGEQKNV